MATAAEASQQANRSGMDPRRLVVIFLLVAGVVLALLLNHVLGLVWAQLGWRNAEVIEGLGWTVTTLLGVALTVGAAVGTWVHPRSKQLSLEVASELMKVTWPSWAETRVSTIAVVVASVVAALILYGMDVFSYQVMVEWLPKLWEKL
ncbi:MAG: preprotein translocase subunit SecE [Myxococcota bacterium]